MVAYRNNVTRFFLGLFLISFFLFPVGSFAAFFTVFTSGELQDALNAAQKNGVDDEILIRGGTFTVLNGKPFTYVAEEDKTLTIVGAGTETTILDGGNSTQVFFINTADLSDDSNADITIRNLTIQNGKNTDGFGGGLCVLTVSANVTVEKVKFFKNSAAGGGGIDILTDTGDITLTNNIFDNNLADFFGGGAELETALGGSITLSGNTFLGNRADNPSSVQGGVGGGAEIFTSFSGDITLTTNTFVNNVADAFSGGTSGGGASVQAVLGGDITLTNNTFMDNRANFNSGDASGGGASVGTDSGSITLTNNTFIRNVADITSGDSFGGGASVGTDSGNITLTNNTFTLNSSIDGNGDGLFVDVFNDTSIISIFNNIVFNNIDRITGNSEDIFVDDDEDGNNTGSPVNLFNNDFSDFFSACINKSGCTPKISQGSNINADPLFVDAANGDIHLQPNSPDIDKGRSTALFIPSTDFEGDPRIVGSEPDIGADEFALNVNKQLTGAPMKSTFKTTSDTSGCPNADPPFVGKFSFSARFTNTSTSSLSNLFVKVVTLTNGNLLENADGGPGGVGTVLTVPKVGQYSDGILSHNESVDVSFVICLTEIKPFDFFVDVFGIAK